MPMTLDRKATALVLIDLQKGVVGMPLGPHSAADVVARSAALGLRFNECAALVVAVNVAFAADGSDRPQGLVDAPMQAPPGGWPEDWAELVPEIASLNPLAVTKKQWGAFHGTDLDLQLRRRGVDTIVLAGIATNFGVESTAREAWQENYSVLIVEDACSSHSPEIHRLAIETILPRISRVRSSAEIIEALDASAGG